MTIEEFNRQTPIHHLAPTSCWCGKPNRLADDHVCGECPDHCELAAHREGRPSPRDAELRRIRSDTSTAA